MIIKNKGCSIAQSSDRQNMINLKETTKTLELEYDRILNGKMRGVKKFDFINLNPYNRTHMDQYEQAMTEKRLSLIFQHDKLKEIISNVPAQ